MIAQEVAAEHPDMLRRVILLGTAPRGGEDLTFADLSVDELDDFVALTLHALFTPSETSQTAGRAYLERLKIRTADKDNPVSKQAATAQLEAIREWGYYPWGGAVCDASTNSAPHAHRTWDQGRRRRADQRVHHGGAHSKRSTHHVSGRQPCSAVPKHQWRW